MIENMPTTMVWTMGKCGTVSLVDGLDKAGIHLWQAHWISGRGKKHPHVEYPSGSVLSAADMIENDHIEPSKFWIPVREPVARSLSSYMQSRNRFGVRNKAEEMFEAATKLYKVEWADEWFEKEIMGLLHFNPYDKPFNHEQGYEVYDHGRHSIAIMRIEDADRVFPDVTYQMYGRRIEMIHRNSWKYRLTNNDKKPLLDEFERMKRMPMPKEFLDRCYSLRYANHFYSQNELAEFRRSWENGSD
jgi:hypothetical protein